MHAANAWYAIYAVMLAWPWTLILSATPGTTLSKASEFLGWTPTLILCGALNVVGLFLVGKVIDSLHLRIRR